MTKLEELNLSKSAANQAKLQQAKNLRKYPTLSMEKFVIGYIVLDVD